jgi:TetR/AcrR family transcriptional regulator, regulator of biofilm formation and stress response
VSDFTPTAADVRPRGAERRDALLEATIKVIGETGIDNVTHRSVAKVAGLPLASTTYWFASKNELIEEAFQYAADRDIALLNSRLAQARALNDAVTAISIVLNPSGDDDQTIGRSRTIAAYALWLEAARRPKLQRIASRWTNAYVTAVSELLVNAGSTSIDDAKLLVAAVDGLVLDQLAQHTAHDLRPTLERLASALLQAQSRPAAWPTGPPAA